MLLWSGLMRYLHHANHNHPFEPSQSGFLHWPKAIAIGSASILASTIFSFIFFNIFFNTNEAHTLNIGLIFIIYLLGVLIVPIGIYHYTLKIKLSQAIVLTIMQYVFLFIFVLFFGVFIFSSLFQFIK